MIKKVVAAIVLVAAIFSSTIAAAEWDQLGLAGRTVYSLTINPNNIQNIYAGTDAGLYVTINGGSTWNVKIASNVIIPDVKFAPLATDSVFALVAGGSFSDGLYYSDDNGITWAAIANYTNPRRLTFDVVNPGFMYICFADGILKSQNYGANVSNANNGLPDTDIIDVLADGANELEAYAVGTDFLSHTINFANSWTDIPGQFNIPGHVPSRIAYDPHEPGTIYVVSDHYFAYSPNRGIFWNYTEMPTYNNSPIVCDPNNVGFIYVGSIGEGVLRSVDGGESFAAVNTGLGDLNVRSLTIGPNGYLYAGTENGVFTIDLATVGIEDSHEHIPSAVELISNYPNPFNSRTVIALNLADNEFGTVEIFDLTGGLVRTLFEGRGYQSLIWDGTDNHNRPVASGVYFYRLTTDGKTEIKRLTLLK